MGQVYFRLSAHKLGGGGGNLQMEHEPGTQIHQPLDSRKPSLGDGTIVKVGQNLSSAFSPLTSEGEHCLHKCYSKSVKSPRSNKVAFYAIM